MWDMLLLLILLIKGWYSSIYYAATLSTIYIITSNTAYKNVYNIISADTRS